MNSNQFKELVKISEDYISAAKRKKINFNEILSGLYADPSHFVYELIQNAEDSGATELFFNLFNDKFEIIHNGKDFDFDDVEGITGIGLSTKKDLNKIGKFGVGFKSVFAITEKPIVESGQYHFSIENFVLPNQLSLNGKLNTKITLPFNHPNRKPIEVFELIENKLQDIGLKTLLFLTNIKEIKWKSPKQSGHYYKSVKSIKDIKNTNRVEIVSQYGDEECFEEYLVINKPIKVNDKKLKVEIAYRLEADENGIEQIVSVSDQESKLVVYFPTEKITYLDFIIQGPFKTTPNRENIPLEDGQNKIIINEISNLVADSLPIIKKLHLLSTSFLEVLPIDDENCDEPIYSSIFESVKNKFLSNENLLPTNHGGYAHPQDSILARGKVLTKLLKSKDIKLLFEKSHWLNTNITFDRTRELRDYLINDLEIKEIDFEDFSENITEDFMKSKNDDWIINYYGELIDRDSLFRERTGWRSEGALRYKPIIRLKNNKHCSPFDSDGKIQVYLPTKTKSSYRTIKSTIAKNETALELLKNLDICKPDIFAEIKEFVLPKYRDEEIEVDDDQYFEDLGKILKAFSNKNSTEKRDELIDNLKDLPIIDSLNPLTGENYLNEPSEVYLNTDDLRNYFDGFESALFINKGLYKKFGQKVFEEFALKIGCNNIPRRIEIEGKSFSWEEKDLITSKAGYSYHNQRSNKDYLIDGIENFFLSPTQDKSFLLWGYLLSSLNSYSTYQKDRFFQGEYCWSPGSNLHYHYYDAKFKKLLISGKWLFNTDNNLVSPAEITLSDLADGYNLKNEDLELLEKELGFKLNEIIEFEEKTGMKAVSPEDYELLQELKRQQNIDIDDDEVDEEWVPDVLPADVQTSISDGEIELTESEDLSGQNPSGRNKPYDSDFDNSDEDGDENEGIPKNKIGEWGEQYVFKYFLETKYSNLSGFEDTDLGFMGKDSSNNTIELKWLNRNNDIGKGYDFAILVNGEELEYIEVKATIKSGRTLHNITGTQWEFARRLFNNGEGEKYKIFAVKEANSTDAKIKSISNPIKLWKEGNLYAHPIKFRV
ncbi:MAG: hypothetical protein SCARUB_04717 [Candidatus Scalindua rubra]|uniref:Uncharacterized protein n=1 Tax=Candidatus Scalindua rubra TaxID=1872076 RepID=A0A1E3X5C6_9BACT|nr:MAG: hypothetical protein SCARUB_04717 [Candidatus Scalindua rubra]